MTKLEALEKRSNYLSEMKGILSKAKNQSRALFPVEEKEFKQLRNRIENIDNQLKTKTNNKEKTETLNMKSSTFSFRKLKLASKGELDQKAVKNEIRKSGQSVADNEYIMNVRAMTPTGGENLIPTQVTEVSPILAEESVIAKAGAKVVSIPADIKIPNLTGGDLKWADCGTDPANDNFTIGNIDLKLQRLSGYFPVCKSLSKVYSPSLEGAMETSIYNLIDEKMNERLFTSFSGVTPVTGASSYEALVAAEGALLSAHVSESNIVYFYNPTDLAKLKARGKKAGEIQEPILSDDKTIGGHPAYTSNYVPAGTVYAVDGTQIWENVAYVGLILDEVTNAHLGEDRLIVNVYGNIAVNTTFVTAATLV